MTRAQFARFVFLCAWAWAPLKVWASWAITPFTAPAGAAFIQLWDVNDAGQIVGQTDTASFIFDHGTFTWMQDANVRLTGISNDGLTLVGSIYDAATQTQSAWYSINGVSHIVGGATAGSTNLFRHVSANGRYAAASFGDVGSSDFSVLVFDFQNQSAHPMVLPQGVTPFVIQGVNDAGVVSGSARLAGSVGQVGLVYDLNSGQTQTFSSLPGFTGAPRFRDVNETGLLAGFVGTTGFVGSFAEGFEAINIPGAQQTFVYGVNNTGVLIGNYVDADGNIFSFTAAQVPEPASALLLLAGVAALGVLRRPRLS